MKGGYQIIDFQKIPLSDSNVTIKGVYDTISGNFNKTLQLNSLNIGGTLKDDVYAFATKGTNKYTFDVYDGILTVTSADNVRWVSHDTIQQVISDIDDLQQETSDIKDMISDAFNAETAYTAGQYCIYNDTLYKCIADTTAGTLPTDTRHFSEVTVADEIGTLNSELRTRIHQPTMVVGNRYFNIRKSGKVKNIAGYFYIGTEQPADSTIANITDSKFYPGEVTFIMINDLKGNTRVLTVRPTGAITTGDNAIQAGSWGIVGSYI